MVHTKVYLYFIIIFFLSFNLSRCDYRNYFYTEDSLKRVAEKSLEEKYGEEFVVHRAWDRSQTMFFADCSPKDNPEVIFTADIEKNGDGVVDDGYVQGLVAKQVDDILKPEFENFFGYYYTMPYNLSYYNEPTFKNIKDITVEEYIDKAKMTSMPYYIYVDMTKITGESIDEESELFEKDIPQMITNKEIPDMSIHIYFTTGELVDQCKEYFSEHVEIDYDLNKEIEKYNYINIKYEDGIVKEVYEGSFLDPKYGDYRELRENINNEISEGE